MTLVDAQPYDLRCNRVTPTFTPTQPTAFISNNSYLVCLTGARSICQPAETYDRAGRQNDDKRLFALYCCTVVAVSVTSDTRYTRQTDYRVMRHLHDGGVWHTPLAADRVRCPARRARL